MRTRVAVSLLVLAASLPSLAAADDWIEVKSPNFTVVSNAGDGRARNIAWQFEQIRAAIQIGWPWARVQLDRPVIVVAAKDENSMKLLIPGFWEKSSRDTRPASVFGTGAAAHYITLRSDVRADDTVGVNPYVSSYWSYSALTLNEAFERPLPLWFRNGLAELLSNSIVRDNEIQFGRAIPWNLRSLQQDGRLRLSELVTLDGTSPYYTNGTTRPRFDAQSWGVIHYMLFGLADGGTRVNQLAELLLQGTSSAEAIQSVFGSVDAAVHATFSRPVEARAAISTAGENRGAATYDVEALLFDREGKRDEARAAYAKAVELNSESFYTHYRLATLLWTSSADVETRRRIETLLRRSVALNNFYSPSQAFLADEIVRGATPADALPIAIRAASLDPSSARARMTLARVLGRVGRRDEAIGHARASRALAQTDAERGAAEELIAFLTRQPQI